MAQEFALLDQAVLDRLAADVGAETVPVLVASLRREIAAAQAALPAHLAAGDLEQLEIAAHALKSAARSFGAMQLGEACFALEDGARTQMAADGLDALMADFQALADETLAVFGGD